MEGSSGFTEKVGTVPSQEHIQATSQWEGEGEGSGGHAPVAENVSPPELVQGWWIPQDCSLPCLPRLGVGITNQ